MMYKKINDAVQRVIGFVTVSQLLGFLKVSFVVGTKHAFFSLSNIFFPLVGKKGYAPATLAVSLLFLVKKLLMTAGGPSPLAFIVPGWCASMYWASDRIWIRLMLPLVCMALFVLHPVGHQAAPYALYWFIPVILFFVNSSSSFATALGSTFVAHAVGSVIWLYTVSMPAASWYALIPVVAVERLCYALGMTVCSYALDWVEEKQELPRMYVKSAVIE